MAEKCLEKSETQFTKNILTYKIYEMLMVPIIGIKHYNVIFTSSFFCVTLNV